jgi:hypothetical protein
MTRADMIEIAKTDPVYAAALGAVTRDVDDQDRINIEIGRAVMAVLALQRHGWALVRVEPEN